MEERNLLKPVLGPRLSSSCQDSGTVFTEPLLVDRIRIVDLREPLFGEGEFLVSETGGEGGMTVFRQVSW